LMPRAASFGRKRDGRIRENAAGGDGSTTSDSDSVLRAVGKSVIALGQPSLDTAD